MLKRILLRKHLNIQSDAELAEVLGFGGDIETMLERTEEGDTMDLIRQEIKSIHPHKFVNRKPISNSVRFQIFTRDNFHCRYCGRGVEDGVKLVVEHIISVKDGGATELSNLVAACFDCNSGKTKHSLLTRSGQIPSYLVLGRKQLR